MLGLQMLWLKFVAISHNMLLISERVPEQFYLQFFLPKIIQMIKLIGVKVTKKYVDEISNNGTPIIRPNDQLVTDTNMIDSQN